MKKRTENQIISLNDKLFNEFTIEELEKRLETDPLLLTTLFMGLANDSDVNNRLAGCSCRKIGACPGLECGCDGGNLPDCTCNSVTICSELHIGGL